MKTYEDQTTTKIADRNGPLSLLLNRNFRLLWIGEAISLIGDQFYLIALPWLVLQLTGDALAMGAVLALAGIPRALFMVLGGALTDRFSARTVMLISNFLRMALVIVLAFIVLTSLIEIWMVYVMALLFGLIDAFFYPAQSAIVPRLIGKDMLQTANAVMQGTMQLSLFAGPVLAGLLIARFGQTVTGQSLNSTGIALAFAIDALTFFASGMTLWLLPNSKPTSSNPRGGTDSSLIREMAAGLRSVWYDPALKAFFILIALSNFLVNGPFFIGIPVLANIRFAEGAAAFGIIMSAYGGGSLLGTVLAGLLPRPRADILGIVLGIVWSGLGIGVVAFAFVQSTVVAATIALLMGIAQGYVVIIFITWLQRRTPDHMLGRMMSILMFASVGLMPLSNILTGALLEINHRALFVSAGGLMAIIVFLFMLNPAVRAMKDEPADYQEGVPLERTVQEATQNPA